MAEYLKPRPDPLRVRGQDETAPAKAAAATLRKRGVIGLLVLAGSAAAAPGLPDPTRPPTGFGAATEPLRTTVATGPVLQSVLISPTRTVAVINGKSLKVGEQFGAARIVKISENEVVMQDGRQVRTLRIFPNIKSQDRP